MGHLGTDDGCQAERGEEASRCGGARRSTQVSGKGRAVVPDEFFVHTDGAFGGDLVACGEAHHGARAEAAAPWPPRKRDPTVARLPPGISPVGVEFFLCQLVFFLEFFCQLVDGGEAKKGLKAC